MFGQTIEEACYKASARGSMAALNARQRIAKLKGQGMIEYVLIAALIAVACIIAMQILSGEIADKFNEISEILHETSSSTNPGFTPGA